MAAPVEPPGAFGRLRHVLFHQHTGTLSLSAAVAIGVFIGLTPFYGLHTVLAIAIAWALRLNIGVTILATQIANPIFAPGLIAASAWLGSIMPPGGASPAARGAWWDPTHPVFYAYWLRGGIALGLTLGLACGLVTFAALSRFRAARAAGKACRG